MAKKRRHPVPIVPTTLNVASWIFRMAYLDNTHIQPMKLHRLLYLAQAHFAALNHGRAFMPAHFIATQKGPIEPNLYQIMTGGLPQLDPPPAPPSEAAIAFLEVVWRKYGHHSPDYLLKVIGRDEAFFKTMEVYPGGVIPLEMIAREYRQGAEAGKIDMPKKYTQSGKVMTDWSIEKEGDPSKVINAKTEAPQQRDLSVAEELALELAQSGGAKKAEILDLRSEQGGFKGMSANDIVAKSQNKASHKTSVVSELAEELTKNHRPRMTVEDAANAEGVAMRILSDLAGMADDAPKQATAKWKPEKAPSNARVYRSSSKVNSAPAGGLPWRKS